VLSHDNVEKYEKSHGDGCLMTPYEGLVVTVDSGGKVVTWRMLDISHMVLTAISKHDGDEIKKQIDAILAEEQKQERVKNFKLRRSG
jgi:hypothetical protein